MAVKILILKSLEDVIAEVQEVFTGLEVTSYKLENPYTVSIQQSEPSNGSDVRTKVGFYPYAPLAKGSTVEIRSDWVVSIVDPIEEIQKSYEEKVNGKSKTSDI